jgi:hypothetical protein
VPRRRAEFSELLDVLSRSILGVRNAQPLADGDGGKSHTLGIRSGPRDVEFVKKSPGAGGVQPAGPVLAYDWRRRIWSRLERDGGWDMELPFQEWDYRVLCPLLPGDIAVFGDVTRYATVGDRRIAYITSSCGGVSFDVLGVPDTVVEVGGYAAKRPTAVTAAVPGETRMLREERAALSGVDEGRSWDAASG